MFDETVRFRDGGRLRRISSFGQLPEILAELDPSIPLLWCGGAENHPTLLAQLAESRPLIGASADAVRRVRDPFQLSDWMSEIGCGFPKTIRPPRSESVTLPTDPEFNLAGKSQLPVPARWLRKPLCSAGGIGIETTILPVGFTGRSDEVLQQRIDGIPMSATLVSDGQRVQWIGCSLQLIGWRGLHARGFQFCGNLGPVKLPQLIVSELRRMADQVVRCSGLRGVFGMDFVLAADDRPASRTTVPSDPGARPWLIEINPRITASHELFEFTSPMSMISEHLRAFDIGRGNDRAMASSCSSGAVGDQEIANAWLMRMIVYAEVGRSADDLFPLARNHSEFDEAMNRRFGIRRNSWTGTTGPAFEASREFSRTVAWLADVPSAGEHLPAYSPICSVYVGHRPGTSRIALRSSSVGPPTAIEDVIDAVDEGLRSLPSPFLSAANLELPLILDDTRRLIAELLRLCPSSEVL